MRLLPTKRLLTFKDQVILVITAYNTLQTNPSSKLQLNKDFVMTSDVFQYLFQIAYKRQDILEVFNFLLDFLIGWASLAIPPESVVIAVAIICFFRKE